MFREQEYFNFISFRSAAAVITSLIISLLIGKRLYIYLQKKQVGEVVRDLGLEGNIRKRELHQWEE